jgi:hypothetical protein
MPREVQFCTEQFSGVSRLANTFGLGHAGLHCDRGAAPFYVTWDGTARGADWNTSQRGAAKVTPFVKMPAHARVGFSELINRQTNTTSANPMGWDQARALTADEDFALPTRGVSKRFDIPVKAAGGVAFDGADNLFGIDVEAIWTWWFEILNLDPEDPRRTYRKCATMRAGPTNCCGMVGRALQVGGLDVYAPPPSNLFYQGTATLIHWVQKAAARINELNRQRAILLGSPEFNQAPNWTFGDAEPDFNYHSELPDVNEWKRRSAVKAGLKTGFARRHEQIAEIDRLLPLYHAARQSAKRQATANGLTALDQPLPDTGWMNYMTLIHHQCYDHLASKPTSDRRVPVLALVKVIYHALSGHKTYMESVSAGTLGMQPNLPAFFSARVGEKFA